MSGVRVFDSKDAALKGSATKAGSVAFSQTLLRCGAFPASASKASPLKRRATVRSLRGMEAMLRFEGVTEPDGF